jgi:5-methylcytosine-specific restriction enzyme A
MGRLRTLQPRLAAVGSRLTFIGRDDLERARDLGRDSEALTRQLYKTARWQRLRLSVLSRDLYTCRLRGRIEGNTSRLVCDHIEPHRDDVARFWAGPFQTLCKACHDGEKQRLERAARG